MRFKIKNINNRLLFLSRSIMLIVAYFFILSCSNTKKLVDNQTLLVKNKLTYSNVKADLISKQVFQNTLRPRPNRKVLGTRARLRVYNAMGEPKKDNFWMFVKENMGEEPVLYDQEFNDKVAEVLIQKSKDNGFFHVELYVSTKTKRKKTIVTYDIQLEKAYKIGNFVFEKDGSILSEDIDSLLENSLLKEGNQYRVKTLREERKRIEFILKNKGYFNFSGDYLIFEADSSDRHINLKLSLKKPISPKANIRYSINNIEIDYGYEAKNGTYNPTKTEYYDSILVRYYRKDYLPFVFTNQLFLKSSKEYRIDDQQKSLRYYSNLNVFKFVNLVFVEDSNYHSKLNVNLYLSSLPKR